MLENVILPDNAYVKLKYKDEFLKLVNHNPNVCGKGIYKNYVKYCPFLKLTVTKCDYSNEPFEDDDQIWCGQIISFKNQQ